MADIVNPRSNPPLAAQQIILELIKAGNFSLSKPDTVADDVTACFDKIMQHYAKLP